MASLTAISMTTKMPPLRWGLLFILVAVLAMALISLYPYSVAEVKLAPGTPGLLKQTAAHMSKMLGGVQIGGFPGFDPEDDDEYQRKIKNSEFKEFEVNYWVKELCNFLEQISQKNPNLTLEQILRLAGLSTAQIHEFLQALQSIQSIADAQRGFGVTDETVNRLTQIMTRLGVGTW